MEDLAGTIEEEEKRGGVKVFRRGFGKLLLVAAGTGAVAVLMFVVIPMLTAPATEPPSLAPGEIVSKVMNEPVGVTDLGPVGDAAPQDLPAMPAPPVAARHNGEEMPVVFPASQEAAASEEVPPEAALPPVLSPEEIDAAVVVPVPEETPPEEAAQAQVNTETASAGDLAQPLRGRRRMEMTLPPPEATREVQELLVSLGYEPGPVDGVWGDRTERAWKRFARDTSDLEARTEQTLPHTPGPAAAPPSPEGSAPASGGTGVEAARGPSQAGPPRAGLPLDRPLSGGKRVRVPGTLRSVMGYRLPLVSRQEVPDQVVSGVLIPAHTTFVILRGGEWELTGLEAHEVERMRDAREVVAAPEPEARRRSWNPLRLFRRQPASADGK